MFFFSVIWCECLFFVFFWLILFQQKYFGQLQTVCFLHFKCLRIPTPRSPQRTWLIRGELLCILEILGKHVENGKWKRK